MEGLFGGTQFLAHLRESRGVGVVAVNVPQKLAHPGERIGIEAAVMFEAVLGARLELIEVPAGLGHSDDRNVESFVADQPLD